MKSIKLQIVPRWLLAFCVLEVFLGFVIAFNSTPVKYAKTILESSNNLTGSVVLGLDNPGGIPPTGTTNSSNTWTFEGFEKENVSTLATKFPSGYSTLLNSTLYISANNTAALTITLKNFSHTMFYLNFSYFIGKANKNANNPEPSKTYPVPSDEPIPEIQNIKESVNAGNIALALAAQPVAQLLSAATKNLIMISSANQQQQPEGNPHLQTQSTSGTHAALEAAANALLNLTMATVSNTVPGSSSALDSAVKITPQANVSNTSFTTKIFPEIVNQSLNDSEGMPNIPTNQENVPINHNLSRRKRYANEESLMVTQPSTIVSPSAMESKIEEIMNVSQGKASSITSDDTNSKPSYELPLAAAHAVEMIKQAAAVAAASAAAASNLVLSSKANHTPLSAPIMNTGHTVAPYYPSFPANGNSVATTPIKETELTQTSQSNTILALKNESNGKWDSSKATPTHRRSHEHHHQGHHHKVLNRSSPTSLGSSDSNRAATAEMSKNIFEVVERSEKNNEMKSDKMMESSSSEEYNGQVEKTRKISYKTWRESIEKRNRPPGFFVTVNEGIIFDNWFGIWDKPYTMGKWTGLKTLPKQGWNETYILINMDNLVNSQDVQITFEWEPMDNDFSILLSDIVISALSITAPPSCEPVQISSAYTLVPGQVPLNANQSMPDSTPKPKNLTNPQGMTDLTKNSSSDPEINNPSMIILKRDSTGNNNWKLITVKEKNNTVQIWKLNGTNEILHQTTETNLNSVLESLSDSVKNSIISVLQKSNVFDQNELTTTAASASSKLSMSTEGSSSTFNEMSSPSTPGATYPVLNSLNENENHLQRTLCVPQGTGSNSKAPRVTKTDKKSALFMSIMTGCMALFLLMFVVYRKVQLSMNSRNAIR